jgi:hypothetical protein
VPRGRRTPPEYMRARLPHLVKNFQQANLP